MPDTSSELEIWKTFRSWAKSNGAFIHPSLTFVPGTRGTSVMTTAEIPTNTTVLSCPFDLAITYDLGIGVFKACIWEAAKIDSLSERQIVCAYIVLHWVILTDRSELERWSRTASHFRHQAYLDTLPHPDQLRTPLQFTPPEFELLKGTNLYGATEDRRKEWSTEWREVRDILADADKIWAEGFTWDRYLVAATYLSSRAFPSSLLSPAPTAQATSEDSYPVLLPVLDCLNHTRGLPVTWQVTNINRSPLHIALLLRSTTPARSEVFNNYGPKPNSELLLGYGFVIKSNPEDTIVLKLGGSEKRHEISRDIDHSVQGGPISELWKEVETMVLFSGEDDASVTSLEGGWEVTLEVCEALEDMLSRKMEALPDAEAISKITEPSIRQDVRDMIVEYVQGQRDILKCLWDYVEERKREAIELARASGLEVQEVLEEDLEEDMGNTSS
ncbi:uncharacterized protein EI90DRAFT_2915493 [Cantharellus anzutake]|uniref:uncharacterized protein n=1 Tax=Cantharellus anzutake TaxID=1750568 RepID=UPI001907DC7D|nr:uncharacterized protein EI90DRAFT_2915493 [Cantharellus anzutake]KAF8333926.1 hypothetical protein EI90DRAFT_2915493 [Cantharellus anzutake]